MPATPTNGAVCVAERVRLEIARLPVPHGCALSASFGVATIDPCLEPTSPEALLSRADSALWAAKRGGKDRVEIDRTWPGRPGPASPAARAGDA